MYRSFPNRILGGVCGGLAVGFHVNVCFLRVTFLVATVISQGAAALMYVMLWWIMPQETLIGDHKRSLWRTLFVIIIVIFVFGIWVGNQSGWLANQSDRSIFGPAILSLTSVIFLLRQVGR